MNPEDYFVRKATAEDAVALLALMRDLAVFERYITEFRITVPELLARGLSNSPQREFTALVAERRGTGCICGYAVYLITPFTYDLRPVFTLKELFVSAAHRRCGPAEALFRAVCEDAAASGAGQLRWLVLPDNADAKRFYTRMGGEPERIWETWQLRLATSANQGNG